MNKDQFMQNLKNRLESLGPTAVAEILADFEDHFANGLSRGKSETEIAAELGNPDDIAQQYIDESPNGHRQTGRAASPAAAQFDAAPVYSPSSAYTSSFAAATSAATPPNSAKPLQAAKKGTISGGALVAVILLNLFIGIPIWISLYSILFGFWVTAGSIGIAACVLFAVALLKAGMAGLILLLFALSLIALTILAIIFMVYLTKWLTMGLGAYIRWNRRLVRGGASV